MENLFRQVDLKTAHRRGSLHFISEAAKEGRIFFFFLIFSFFYFTDETLLISFILFLTGLNTKGMDAAEFVIFLKFNCRTKNAFRFLLRFDL